MNFEWGERKARRNHEKHGISFEEAMTAFADWQSLTIPDPEHSESEERFLLLGLSNRGNILVVSHVERRDNIRIISARRANSRERQEYEEKL